MRVSIPKTFSEMTEVERKQYKHEKYKTATYELTLKLTDLTEEQFAIIASIIKAGV